MDRKENVKRQNELIRWGLTVTDEQRRYLFQSGAYNDACRGYLIQACRLSGFTEQQISDLLATFSEGLSTTSVEDAETIYQEFET